MKKLFLCLTLLLFGANVFAAPGTLLILTEDTAQGYIKNEFPIWLSLVRQQTNYWSNVVVRTLPRWNEQRITNDWPLLNKMSNNVILYSPKAVVIIGCLPYLMTGWWNPDGHTYRCSQTDVWLACIPGLTFTDAVNWGDTGYAPPAYPANRNLVGDGRPDQMSGTKIRWVARIDFSGMPYKSDSGSWSSGCLNGYVKTPAVDEGDALRNYFTNNIDYRTGRWVVNTNGLMTGTIWASPTYNTSWSTLTNNNSNVSWTRTGTPTDGGNIRYYYDNWDSTEVEYLYNSSTCIPTRAVVEFTYRSFGMEVYYGGAYNLPFRRLQPGRQSEPYALVYLWTYPGPYPGPYFIPNSANVLTGDIIDTSITQLGGTWDFGMEFRGDPTIPLVSDSRDNTMTINTLVNSY